VDSLKVLDPEWPIREADVASDNAILWRAIAYSQGRRAGRHPKYGVWCVGQSAFYGAGAPRPPSSYSLAFSR
jgi:hypothetical protein